MAAFVGDAGVIGSSGPFDRVPRGGDYKISRTALGALGHGGVVRTFGDSGRKRSVEGGIQVVDSTTPAARAFVRFGGPRRMDRSLTVAARKRSRLGNGRVDSETVTTGGVGTIGNHGDPGPGLR